MSDPASFSPTPRPRSALDGLDPRLLMAEGLGLSPDHSGDEPPVVPGYEILRLLGAGGMGRVWLARQTSLDRLVAVKVLAMRGAAATQWLDRLEREARSMARLSHPHIVAVFDFVRLDDGGAAIVMEWVSSGSLREKWLESGKPVLDLQAVLTTIRQIASALAAAHGAGIVHRDLKPENILVAVDGNVKVTDFGLALPLGPEAQRLTLTGTAMGTFGYMAPEQIEGREVDERADWYSVGVIFYECLTGIRPQGHFDPPGKLRRDLPNGLDSLIADLLRTNPAKRVASSREFLSKLDRCGRTRLSWVAAAVLCLLFLSGTGYLLSRGVENRPEPSPSPNQEPPPLPASAPSPALRIPADWERRVAIQPLRGQWDIGPTGFRSDGDIAVLQLLGSLPPEGVRVRLEFTRLEGADSIATFFRTQRGFASAEISAWENHLAGFQCLDGLDLRVLPNSPVVPIENRRRYEMEIELHPDRARLSLDGRLIQEIEIARREFSITFPWEWDHLDTSGMALAIGSYESPTWFHAIEISPINVSGLTTPQVR